MKSLLLTLFNEHDLELQICSYYLMRFANSAVSFPKAVGCRVVCLQFLLSSLGIHRERILMEGASGGKSDGLRMEV